MQNMVDLAGSERISQTKAEGQRLKEGTRAHPSTPTLAHRHIPYRNSKLTRIHQPSIGGNARTAIICTITPASLHCEKTLSALKSSPHKPTHSLHMHPHMHTSTHPLIFLPTYAYTRIHTGTSPTATRN